MDINCYMFFDFLISLLNVWKDFKVLSRFLQKWIQPPACLDHGLHRILSSYWLAHFYLMKKSARVLLYFGLDCGMLEFSLLTSHNPKNNWCPPAFLEHGSAEKIAVWAHANQWCPFQGLSNGTTFMQIQSGRTVPLKVDFTFISAACMLQLEQLLHEFPALILSRIESRTATDLS